METERGRHRQGPSMDSTGGGVAQAVGDFHAVGAEEPFPGVGVREILGRGSHRRLE